MLMNIQTQEGNTNIVYFWKVVLMGKSATSESYVQIVKKAVSSEGSEFETHFNKI